MLEAYEGMNDKESYPKKKKKKNTTKEIIYWQLNFVFLIFFEK